MEIDLSNDSFKAETNINVEAQIHAPHGSVRTPQNLEDIQTSQKTPDNVNAIQIIEKDIPLKKEEIEAMKIDLEDKMDYEINYSPLKYREQKTPESTTIESSTETASSPFYEMNPKLIEMTKSKTKIKTPY